MVSQLAGHKLAWARHHGYGFEFFVTNALAPAIHATGLRHFEYAKPFALVAAAHGRAARGLARSRGGSARDRAAAGDWLAWLDHDCWPHHAHGYDEAIGGLDAYLDAVPPGASVAIGNFRSLNTGVVFGRLDASGRAWLLDWLLAVVGELAQCQPYDQAALQLLLFARLNGTHVLDASKPPPFGYTCKRPACGGTIEKPFGMCNPNYATSVHELLSSRGLCPDADKGCHEHVDRARANAVVNGAGFHVLKEAPGRPRVQCFNSQRLDGCRTQPGANFARSDDEDDGRWLINHKGMNLFLESRARGANASAADCRGLVVAAKGSKERR